MITVVNMVCRDENIKCETGFAAQRARLVTLGLGMFPQILVVSIRDRAGGVYGVSVTAVECNP